ncbi:MAG TPA: ubiquitin-like small modifier protein 1, partial [Anaerolineae bacterium]
ALNALTARYPNLRQHLFTEDGSLRSFVNVYLNGEDVRYLQQTRTLIKESDQLSIVPSVAGGSSTNANR